MSEKLGEDFLDTDVLRGGWPDNGVWSAGSVVHRLCNEVDRLRAALKAEPMGVCDLATEPHPLHADPRNPDYGCQNWRPVEVGCHASPTEGLL